MRGGAEPPEFRTTFDFRPEENQTELWLERENAIIPGWIHSQCHLSRSGLCPDRIYLVCGDYHSPWTYECPDAVHGQAMTLRFSNCAPCLVLSCFSRVWLSVILWTIACQAPLSVPGPPGMTNTTFSTWINISGELETQLHKITNKPLGFKGDFHSSLSLTYVTLISLGLKDHGSEVHSRHWKFFCL